MGFVIRSSKRILSKTTYIYCTGMSNGKMDQWSDEIEEAKVFETEGSAKMCSNMESFYQAEVVER